MWKAFVSCRFRETLHWPLVFMVYDTYFSAKILIFYQLQSATGWIYGVHVCLVVGTAPRMVFQKESSYGQLLITNNNNDNYRFAFCFSSSSIAIHGLWLS